MALKVANSPPGGGFMVQAGRTERGRYLPKGILSGASSSKFSCISLPRTVCRVLLKSGSKKGCEADGGGWGLGHPTECLQYLSKPLLLPRYLPPGTLASPSRFFPKRGFFKAGFLSLGTRDILGQIIFVLGAALCIAGCWAASRVSTHSMPPSGDH